MGKIIIGILVVLFIICAMLSLCTGCASKPAIVVDTGDIEQLRHELESLRGEYDRLQSDYSRLADESQFYADYYRRATTILESGLGELGTLGADSAGEIQKLRSYVAILRNIVNNLISGE
jgi:outer membrane murein-binding lipoprotein Lpp